jgi:hypothetical protein
LTTQGTGTAPLFGNPLNSFWHVQNTAAPTIEKIVFDGAPARISFDIGGTNKSPGSLAGQVIAKLDAPAPVLAIYQNQLLVGGSAYGDQWTLMSLATNLPAGQQMFFVADTDKANTALTVVPSVPEPEHAYAAGLAVLGFVYWRNRQRTGANNDERHG